MKVKHLIRKADPYLRDKRKTAGLLQAAAKKAAGKESGLKGYWERLQLFFEVIKAWLTGEYKQIPYLSIASIVGALIYFVSPMDFIPDFLFTFGLLDDAAVIAFIAKQVNKDLDEYVEWKEQKDKHLPEIHKTV